MPLRCLAENPFSQRYFIDKALDLVGEMLKLGLRLVRGPKIYTPEAPVLSAGEARRLVYGEVPGRLPTAPVKARDRVMLAVMYFGGLRVSEPGRLRVEHVSYNPEEDAYSILVALGKWAERDHRIPLYDPIVGRLFAAWVEVLRPQMLGELQSPWLFPSARVNRSGEFGPLAKGSVWRIFKSAVKQAGIERRGRRLSTHILRHSIATHLLEGGADIDFVQKWMRHRDVRTTQRYLHSRRSKAKAIFRGRGAPLRPGNQPR